MRRHAESCGGRGLASAHASCHIQGQVILENLRPPSPNPDGARGYGMFSAAGTCMVSCRSRWAVNDCIGTCRVDVSDLHCQLGSARHSCGPQLEAQCCTAALVADAIRKRCYQVVTRRARYRVDAQSLASRIAVVISPIGRPHAPA